MKNKIVVSISGWGSDREIFGVLLRQCPELQEYQHISLPWQNFVAESAPGPLLCSELQKQLSIKILETSETFEAFENLEKLQHSDILLLGWSLGAMLCLELGLQLSLQLGQKLAESKPNIALILLAPSAAMCQSAPSQAGQAQAEIVNPIALKLMQRKLEKNGKQVLLDFAHNCQRQEPQESQEIQKSKPSTEFTSRYLDAANQFLESEPHSLHAGLEYLIRCNLNEALSTQPMDLPCLLISGRHDAIMPSSQAVELARLLPNTELVQIEAGHNLLLPPPKELLEAMQKFIKKVH